MRLFGVIAAALVLQISACTTRPVQLPTSGRVYVERTREGVVSLSPAPGILVLVERINVCDKGKWLPTEASTTGIDAFLVRSDANGNFAVPPRSFSDVCTRVALAPRALAPGYSSVSGYVVMESPFIQDKSAFFGIKENDAILEPQKLSQERAKDLAQDLRSTFTSSTVTITMMNEILREMKPEISQLAVAFPNVWQTECTEYDVCGEYQGSRIPPSSKELGK